MTRRFAGGLFVAAVFCAAPVLAQEGGTPPEMSPEEKAMMEAYQKAGTPGPQHQKLAESAGTYDVKVKSWNAPGAPPEESNATATRTVDLGGRIIVERFDGTMMGQPFTGRSTMGFDNVTGKYWATWTDSMSTGMMMSEGTCDEKDVCTFVGSWNDPLTKTKMTSRFVTRRTGPKTEFFEMFSTGADGKETKSMEMTYTKK